jgi:pimeloyl-ACP methyl ester carboxylesterase
MSDPVAVLVHGAFAESASWNGVISRLAERGVTAVAVANPLRSLDGDAAYVRDVVASIGGPVVLVGHSYGGQVITQAAAGNDAVRALVFVSAFAPAQGESALALTGRFPGSTLGDALTPVSLPGGHVDLYIDQAKFPQQFAADVPVRDAKLSAVAQRPIDQAALAEHASGPQAWQTTASYDLISGADRNIPAAVQEWMAQRAHAEVKVVEGASHSVFVSHPGTTASFIEKAARENVR